MKRSTRQEKEELAELSGAGGPEDDPEPSLSPEELDTVESWVTREDTDPIRPH